MTEQGGQVREAESGQVYRIKVGDPATVFYCTKIIPTAGGFEARDCFVLNFVRHEDLSFMVDYRQDQGVQKFAASELRSVENIPILPWMQKWLEDAKVELKLMAESPYAADEDAFFKTVMSEFARARDGKGDSGEA